MTHTLHPEIEKTIQRLVNRIKQDVVTGKEDDVYGLIIGYLAPYLLPPSQHLKDEPNYDAACMYVVANGLNITAEDVKGILKAAKVEDNEPLPEKDDDRFEQLQDARIESLEGRVSKIYKLIIKLAEKQNVAKEELKQSTPKIEPHIQKIQGMGPYNEMTVVESKINELIDDNMRLWDYINNTLPTNPKTNSVSLD